MVHWKERGKQISEFHTSLVSRTVVNNRKTLSGGKKKVPRGLSMVAIALILALRNVYVSSRIAKDMQ